MTNKNNSKKTVAPATPERNTTRVSRGFSRLSEASDSGAFGGAGCFVVPVDSLPLELGVIDFIVVRYILVLFDPVVSLRVLVELFEGAACVSVVVLVLAGCVVISVDGIGLSVVVRLVW